MKRAVETKDVQRFVVLVLIPRPAGNFDDHVDRLGRSLAERKHEPVLPRIEYHRPALPALEAMPLRLTVKVKPGSRRPGITRADSTLVVAVRERATDGRANAAVIAAIAAWLGIAPTYVRIEHGTSGRTKRVAIEGVDEHVLEAAINALI
jgi:uncharacterized protein